MDIGKPKRIIEAEPLEDPFKTAPAPATPAPAPEKAPATPEREKVGV